jgi:[ribosomal protein S5]-alanine N-acetyltransferase
MYIELDNDILIKSEINNSDDICHINNWFLDTIVCKYNTHCKFFEKLTPLENNNNNICLYVFKKIPPIKTKSPTINHGLSSKIIGKICLQNINWINRNAEFSCIFGDKKEWGKGYASTSIKFLFNHGFNQLGLNKIWLGTSATNKGMIKVAEKLGMIKEGELQDHLYLEGEFTNMLIYSIKSN